MINYTTMARMNVSMAHGVGTLNCHRRLHMAMQRGAHHCAAAQRTAQHTLELLCCVRLAMHSLPSNAHQAKSLAALTAPQPSTRGLHPAARRTSAVRRACLHEFEASAEPFRDSTLRFGVCILPPRGLGKHISEACMATHESEAEISKCPPQGVLPKAHEFSKHRPAVGQCGEAPTTALWRSCRGPCAEQRRLRGSARPCPCMRHVTKEDACATSCMPV